MVVKCEVGRVSS